MTSPYTTEIFYTQLRNIRLYRGYARQSHTCKKLNISRQVWSLWELGKRKPLMDQLILLANFFSIDIGYFFIPGAEPEDYDLLQKMY